MEYLQFDTLKEHSQVEDNFWQLKDLQNDEKALFILIFQFLFWLFGRKTA